MSRAQQGSADPKQILHTTMHRQEALRVSDRLEPAHLALALPRRLMRDLRSVVLVLLRAVYDGRHHGTVRRGITTQLVGDQPARRAALIFQQFPKETGGCLAIAPGLDEDVTVLVNRPPEIPTSALDLHKQLVEMPRIAQTPTPSPQRPRVLRAEGLTPLPNRLVGNDDATLREQVLGIAETQAEPVIQPDGVADDFRWKSVSSVAEFWGIHRRSVQGTPST